MTAAARAGYLRTVALGNLASRFLVAVVAAPILLLAVYQRNPIYTWARGRVRRRHDGDPRRREPVDQRAVQRSRVDHADPGLARLPP